MDIIYKVVLCLLYGFALTILLRTIIYNKRDIVNKFKQRFKSAKEIQKENDIKIAAHEAGHLIAAWTCTAVASISEISFTDDGAQICFVHFNDKEREQYLLWCELVIALGGIAGEMKVNNKCRSGNSRSDLRKARDIAGKITMMFPWNDAIQPLKTQSFPLESAYKNPLSLTEWYALAKAYTMARHIIHSMESSFNCVRNEFLLKKHLSYEDLDRLLPTRKLFRIFGTNQKATFILPTNGLNNKHE